MEATMALTGYVGSKEVLRQTKTGISTISFRIGSTPRIRTDNGWINGTTTWVTVVCYRSLADHVGRCVIKGDPVVVHGKVRTQSWVDPQGVLHEKMVIEAQAVGHDLSRGVSAFSRVSLREPATATYSQTEAITAEEDASEDETPQFDEDPPAALAA